MNALVLGWECIQRLAKQKTHKQCIQSNNSSGFVVALIPNQADKVCTMHPCLGIRITLLAVNIPQSNSNRD